MRKLLTAPGAGPWATAAMRTARLSELDALSARLALPSFTVVVVGNTGAGKSTMLNALLGETEARPGACAEPLSPEASGPRYEPP